MTESFQNMLQNRKLNEKGKKRKKTMKKMMLTLINAKLPSAIFIQKDVFFVISYLNLYVSTKAQW